MLKFKSFFLLFLIWIVCLPLPASAEIAGKAATLSVPESVNQGLQHLLDVADPDKQVVFEPRAIAGVLNFVESPKSRETIYYGDIIRGLASAYYDFDIHKNFPAMVDYAFNPEIPRVALMPSSTRIFKWLESPKNQQARPNLAKHLENNGSPVVFRGRQFIENTPDLNSGAYYGYHLHHTLLFFKYHQRNIVITVSKQADVSTVGKKGYVLGADNDWDYFYSGKTGLTLPALGWVESYMYDSQGINIYDDIDPAAGKVRCAMFKWLRAGWSGINMVQRKHIYRGLKRFAATFKEIIESSLLPPAAIMINNFDRIRGLSHEALQSKMKAYYQILKSRYNSNNQLSKNWPVKLIENQNYWHAMAKEEMESAMIVEYMKYVLGKNRSEEVELFLGLR